MGVVLDELEQTGLAASTVVAIIGDHGWQLGEHNLWGKLTNMELGTRVPLLIRSPQPSHAALGGSHSRQLAELVDLSPTLAALAGLPQLPPGAEGVSLAPLFDKQPLTPAKTAAFSQFPRCPADLSTHGGAPLRVWDANCCNGVSRE